MDLFDYRGYLSKNYGKATRPTVYMVHYIQDTGRLWATKMVKLKLGNW